MRKKIELIIIISLMFLLTGCSEKLYTYRDVVRKTNGKIAKDLIIEDPGYFNRNNGLRRYKGYLVRDKYKEITIINGRDYLLPFAQNYNCTDFAEKYLVPEFDKFKKTSSYDFDTLYIMKVESMDSSLNPKFKDLKITIDCNEKDKYLTVIKRFKEFLNENDMYLNENGINRYEIYCQNGQKYYDR